MRILSRNQFAMSNFNREGYGFNEIEGTFKGTMQFAVWAENVTLLLMSSWTMAEKSCALLFRTR